MNADYDKILEFFSEHETAIYGLGPTDYGAKEGSLLWCIKALDEVYRDDISTCSTSEDKILTVICSLIDIYENHKPSEPDISEREREQYDALRQEVERIREAEAIRCLEEV